MVPTAATRPAPTRIGMLGAGFMARTHSHAALASRAELALIAASTPESSARAAIELGYERGVSVDELLAAELPVVHVCTPNETHVEYARAALRGGSHVICEKPLAISGSAANGLAAEAAELDRIGAVPFVYRYHPMVREARERIRAGAAGSIVTISGQYLQDWLLEAQDDNWRVDPDAGGPSRAFADIGSHLVDLVEFVSGDRITRLVSAVRTLHPERAGKSVATEDTVALTAELAGGGVASMLVSQVAPGRKNGLVLEIGGSKESVRFEQEDPERLWVGRREQSLLLQKDPDFLSDDAARLCRVPAGHPQGYQDAFNAFVRDAYDAMRGAAPEGLPTFVDGARAAMITDAVLQSANSGQWVEVSQP